MHLPLRPAHDPRAARQPGADREVGVAGDQRRHQRQQRVQVGGQVHVHVGEDLGVGRATTPCAARGRGPSPPGARRRTSGSSAASRRATSSGRVGAGVVGDGDAERVREAASTRCACSRRTQPARSASSLWTGTTTSRTGGASTSYAGRLGRAARSVMCAPGRAKLTGQAARAAGRAAARRPGRTCRARSWAPVESRAAQATPPEASTPTATTAAATVCPVLQRRGAGSPAGGGSVAIGSSDRSVLPPSSGTNTNGGSSDAGCEGESRSRVLTGGLLVDCRDCFDQERRAASLYRCCDPTGPQPPPSGS